MAALTTFEMFAARTAMPRSDVQQIAAVPEEKAWVETALEDTEDELNIILRKRYDVPFSAPAPRTFTRWVVAIVTLAAMGRRGWNPSSEQDDVTYVQPAARAWAAAREAADSENGLAELPLRADAQASGVSKGGPYFYSEASPYTSMDVQAERARDERWRR